jgi:hypothetical protein
MATVIGEVPGKAACVRALHRVLNPGGTLAFVESLGDPDRQLAEPEGFELLATEGNNRRHDLVRFRRLS